MNIEQIAEENERRIVRFKNIDKESFTHSYKGISITVEAGKDYVARFPEADLLATHLARKILAREKKTRGAKDDPKAPLLWTNEEVADLKNKIITPIGSEFPQKLSAEEARKLDQKHLEEKYTPNPPVAEVTKADVIRDLRMRGIEPDVNKSKEELLKELMDLEATPPKE